MVPARNQLAQHARLQYLVKAWGQWPMVDSSVFYLQEKAWWCTISVPLHSTTSRGDASCRLYVVFGRRGVLACCVGGCLPEASGIVCLQRCC